MKLIIGIPTINRADLLNEALAKYFEDFKETEIVICDNGNQEIITREKKFVIYRPESNLNVSGSWNMIMDYAKKVNATHVLMLNDDVYLGKTEIEIQTLLRLWGEDIPFFNSEMNWCSFIMSVKGFEKVGAFDADFFLNYFNDNDMFYRMKLLGMQMIYTAILNPVIYRNSMTIAKDPSLNSRFLEYRQNYINKWGGLPSEEIFITPFNK
jgi:GT2 family glycosyltransferase